MAMTEAEVIASIPEQVATLRTSFLEERTLSKEWRISQLKALLRMVTEGKDELLAALKADLNKNVMEAHYEFNPLVADIHHSLEELSDWMKPRSVATSLMNQPGSSTIKPDPLGVTLVIAPWNYPVLLCLQPVVGAIAAGNCVMMKPGNYAPRTSETIVHLVNKYMDNQCIKAVHGDTPVATELLKHKWDLIFFTGSPAVGKIIATKAGETLTPCVLELGGKSPCIIDKTADIGIAAKRVMWGAMTNSGQTCVRPDHILVHADIADRFIDAAKGTLFKFFGPDPKASDSFGRMVNDTATQRLASYIEDARPYVVYGGDVNIAERYIGPTLLDFGDDFEAFSKSKAMCSEVFGPLLPIYRYTNLDDVIHRAKRLDKPLAMYIFSSDSKVINALCDKLSAGSVAINEVMLQLVNESFPFGGVGLSGMGAYHGEHSFKTFSHMKPVLHRSTWFDAKQRYPPYTARNLSIMQALLTLPRYSKYLRTSAKVVGVVAVAFLLYRLLKA